ncbi:hypothetical protein HPB48_008991 [Haemaphysalis longicornis]|uniref:Secreted protein n=1 Tax=Haemaphysalis longicornis TaxID=44386 RepID=A0A9J6H1A5_HAELO|nr:hypothetical protein HPB48_008991 [Haemaphysalis longicornis]
MRICAVARTVVLVACLVFDVAPPLRASRIELKENGYTGIVVALSARLQGNVAGRQLIPPLEMRAHGMFVQRRKQRSGGFRERDRHIKKAASEKQPRNKTHLTRLSLVGKRSARSHDARPSSRLGGENKPIATREEVAGGK